MAETAWPFAGQDLDPDPEVAAQVAESQWSLQVRNLATSGVVGQPGGQELQGFSEAVGARRVSLRPGSALVRGHAYTNDAQIDFDLAANASSATRYDTIVLRLDPAEPLATRLRAVVLPGTAGGGPPALTRSSTGVWDLPLATFPVSPGATVVPSGTSAYDVREFAGVDVVPCRSSADVGPDRRRIGTLAVEPSAVKVWLGTGWRTLGFADVLADPWLPYTPTWSSTTGSTTPGTGGQLIGRYKKAGRTVNFEARLLLGAGASGGSGNSVWSWALPTPRRVASGEQGMNHIGDASVRKSGRWLHGMVHAQPAGDRFIVLLDGADREIGGLVPSSWAPGDDVRVRGAYESAG